jgi:L-alanine-DL-glutamate epimerase-like enolase superfamily enzyme
MRIAELTAYQVRIPLVRPIRHASHARTSTDNLIVRCLLDDGTEGFGEGVPREYVTGETIDSAIALLRHSDMAAELQPCSDFRMAVDVAERLHMAPIPGDDRACQGNAAQCAVELALLDAFGRHFGEPLSRVTQLLAADLYEPRETVRYSYVVTSARGLKLLLVCLLLRAYRFRQVKVKVGIEGYDDLARLRAIRRRLGRSVDLRIDANEAWQPSEVVERIRALEPFGITSVEQPVPHADVGCLAEVRRQVRTPIMLDESLCSEIDGKRAIEQGTCDLFNLRLSKCGGFIPSLRLAQMARRHGLSYQLGCQVGETALLSAAGRHFASSVSGLRYLEGSYDRHLVREPLATSDITFGWGGRAPALTGPGLGVTVDPVALDRVTVRKEAIIA